MAILKETVESVQRVGLVKTCHIAWSRLYDFHFDKKYNIETTSRYQLEELSIDSDDETINRGQMYQPSGTLSLKKLFKSITLPPNPVFVDYGSGKARTLIVAALCAPFKKLIGIEFAKDLCEVAEKNITNFKKVTNSQKEFVIEHTDATKYTYKGDENFFYFFYPFDEKLMRKVLADISQSLKEKPRKAQLIYYYPIHKNVVEEMETFKLKKTMMLYGYPCLIYDNY